MNPGIFRLSTVVQFHNLVMHWCRYTCTIALSVELWPSVLTLQGHKFCLLGVVCHPPASASWSWHLFFWSPGLDVSFPVLCSFALGSLNFAKYFSCISALLFETKSSLLLICSWHGNEKLYLKESTTGRGGVGDWSTVVDVDGAGSNGAGSNGADPVDIDGTGPLETNSPRSSASNFTDSLSSVRCLLSNVLHSFWTWHLLRRKIPRNNFLQSWE